MPSSAPDLWLLLAAGLGLVSFALLPRLPRRRRIGRASECAPPAVPSQ